jgi:transcriptional regulator with XRE-family HTH domain
MEELSKVAQRIRGLREACDCTAADVAAGLGIPVESYLAYEREGADVPISVLYYIARRFHVGLSELLTGSPARLDTVCVVRKDRAPVIDRHPGYSFMSLAGGFSGKVMEPLLVVIEAGDGPAALASHRGQEFNMVLAGTIELLWDGRAVVLEAGDCAYFDPSRPHGHSALNGQPATFLTVITEMER